MVGESPALASDRPRPVCFVPRAGPVQSTPSCTGKSRTDLGGRVRESSPRKLFLSRPLPQSQRSGGTTIAHVAEAAGPPHTIFTQRRHRYKSRSASRCSSPASGLAYYGTHGRLGRLGVPQPKSVPVAGGAMVGSPPPFGRATHRLSLSVLRLSDRITRQRVGSSQQLVLGLALVGA